MNDSIFQRLVKQETNHDYSLFLQQILPSQLTIHRRIKELPCSIITQLRQSSLGGRKQAESSEYILKEKMYCLWSLSLQILDTEKFPLLGELWLVCYCFIIQINSSSVVNKIEAVRDYEKSPGPAGIDFGKLILLGFHAKS